MIRIAIIGAGAAGLMAAHFAAKGETAEITLYEKNPVCGKKVRITGKGRCNVTTATPVPEMEPMLPRGGKFLRTALYAFSPEACRAFFEEAGVPLKVERGARVFPVSDRAADIVSALVKRALESPRVKKKQEKVLEIHRREADFLVKTDGGEALFDRVLIATGGLSYPTTGSDGDGYRFAKALGHSVTPLSPSLVPLEVKGSLCKEMMGLSLKNTALEIRTPSGKRIYEDFGEMLFCHFGVSGPMVLSASAYLDFEKEASYEMRLNLKPALSPEELDRRILKDFEENRNRDLVNALSRLLPQKIIRPVLSLAGLDERKKVNLITKAERHRLGETIQKMPFEITGFRPIREAIVTRGGVSLSEIDPRTMQSKIVPGLFFAGEVMDLDALTGGYNLQIAFSTAYLAAKFISQEVL